MLRPLIWKLAAFILPASCILTWLYLRVEPLTLRQFVSLCELCVACLFFGGWIVLLMGPYLFGPDADDAGSARPASPKTPAPSLTERK